MLSLIDGLSAKGFIPYVVTPETGRLIDELNDRNIPVTIIPFKRWIHEPAVQGNLGLHITSYAKKLLSSIIRWQKNREVVKEIQKIVEIEKIDLIYTNSVVTPIGAMLAKACKLPHIWHLREFGDMDFCLKWDFGHRFSRGYISSKSDAVICVSESIKNHFVQPSAEKKFHVVYNGIATDSDFSLFEKRLLSVNRPESKLFTFAIVGSIQPAKGQESAIRALAEVHKTRPDVKLIVAGGGETAKLEDLVVEFGLNESVTFTGHVDDPYEIYEQTDVVLMCSHSEGMGRVTVEAMAAGKPVIGYDNAGTSELIVHGETGLLYSGGYMELAALMLDLMDDCKLYKKLAVNGFQFAKSRFTTEHYVEQITKILNQVTKHKN